MTKNFTGTIIEESLEKKDVLQKVKIIKTRTEKVTDRHRTPWVEKWTLDTVEIVETDANAIANDLSNALDSRHPWYADFKNDDTHYIIFYHRVFKINRTSQKEYEEAKQYGISLGIPEYQVNFRAFAIIQNLHYPPGRRGN